MTKRNDFELLASAIESQMQLKNQIDVVVGARELGAHSQRDRIVLVPLGGTLTPATSAVLRRGGLYIRPLYSNTLTVVAHVQARSMTHALKLWTDLLTAVRTVFGRASTPGDYTIDTEGARAAYVHGEGASLSQAFTWELMITSYESEAEGSTVYGHRLALLSNMDLTYGIDTDEE